MANRTQHGNGFSGPDDPAGLLLQNNIFWKNYRGAQVADLSGAPSPSDPHYPDVNDEISLPGGSEPVVMNYSAIHVDTSPAGTGNLGPWTGSDVDDLLFVSETFETSGPNAFNWGEFLHLTENSPCVDVGQLNLTESEPEEEPPHNGYANEDVNGTFYVGRDFDDQHGAIDEPSGNTPPQQVPRDIGADEFPTEQEIEGDISGFHYWWESMVTP